MDSIVTKRLDLPSALRERFGETIALVGSRSLFSAANGRLIIYARYSKVHGDRSTFYGLRIKDLDRIRGLNAFIALLWNGQTEPLLLPLDKFWPVFASSPVGADGQIKVQILMTSVGTELYVARAGRHNVDPYFGWQVAEESLRDAVLTPVLTHSQVQTLLGSIGKISGFDVWLPLNDRSRFDSALAPRIDFRGTLPANASTASRYLEQIDVIWLSRGSGDLEALWEIEHSTPIYSGLLRLNDIRCEPPGAKRYNIVSNTDRRDAFARQIARPTFRASGLSEVCGFMEYADVYRWHSRLSV
jgi:hypothetical protein